MKNTIAMMVCAFSIAWPFSCCSQQAQAANMPNTTEELCIAYVDDAKAIFFFPITDADQWEWFRYPTKENALEYSWEVTIPREGGAYNFGFFLFKPSVKAPALIPKKGTLSQLLKDAQLTVFENSVTPQGGVSGHINEKLKVEGWVQDGGIVLGIRDDKTFRQMFKEKPEKAFFLIRDPEEENFSCTAAIKYSK